MPKHRKALNQIHQERVIRPDGTYEVIERRMARGAAVSHSEWESQSNGFPGFVDTLDKPIDINECIAGASKRLQQLKRLGL